MDLRILNCDFEYVKENAFFVKYTKGLKGFKLFEDDNHVYYSNKEEGIDLVFIDDILSSIHLFGKGHNECNIFQGDLPFDINFSDSKSMVYEKFGSFEIKKGGGEVLPILGKSNEWSMFKFGNYYVRFEFKEEKIVLITISSI